MIKVMKVEPLHGGAFAGGNRLARLKEEELKANEDSASANSTSADEERSADEEGHDDDLSQWSQASLGSKVVSTCPSGLPALASLRPAHRKNPLSPPA
mmetsp:Transcript_35200/g.110827  ORF Transcript_35200/g.110827 Transcript_35200/m.110827 type:complete len:98 (+) Transcript_35200:131-424(+)